MRERRAGASPAPSHTVPFGGVEIRLPATWEDRSVFVLSQTRDDGAFEPNFSVARLPRPEHTPFRQIVRQHPVSEQLDCLLVLSRDFREEEGRPVFERVMRFVEPQEGAVLHQAQRFILHDRDVVIMTLTAPPLDFDGAYAVFDRAAHRLAAASGDEPT